MVNCSLFRIKCLIPGIERIIEAFIRGKVNNQAVLLSSDAVSQIITRNRITERSVISNRRDLTASGPLAVFKRAQQRFLDNILGVLLLLTAQAHDAGAIEPSSNNGKQPGGQPLPELLLLADCVRGNRFLQAFVIPPGLASPAVND